MTVITITDMEFFSGILTMSLTLDPPVTLPASDPQSVLLNLTWDRPNAPRRLGVLRFSRMKAKGGGSYRATVPLPDPSLPLHGVTIRVASPSDHIVFNNGLDARIAHLFPRNDAEYVAQMQSHLKRWGSEKTRYFLTEQVVRHFPGGNEHRIGAVLIMAYKAVEMGDADCGAAALAANITAFEWLDALGVDWHPRRNREHLEISLLTTQWHLELAGGDIAAMHETLRRILPLSQRLSNYATPAYSASKGLLLLGWLEWQLGDAEAAAHCWHQTVEVFKNAARDADPYRAVLFRELTHSLDAAYMAGLCLRAIPVKAANEMPSLEQIFAIAARVVPLAKRRLQNILADHLAEFQPSPPKLAGWCPRDTLIKRHYD